MSWLGSFRNRRTQEEEGLHYVRSKPRTKSPAVSIALPSARAAGRVTRRLALAQSDTVLCTTCRRYSVVPGGGVCPACGWVVV